MEGASVKLSSWEIRAHQLTQTQFCLWDIKLTKFRPILFPDLKFASFFNISHKVSWVWIIFFTWFCTIISSTQVWFFFFLNLDKFLYQCLHKFSSGWLLATYLSWNLIIWHWQVDPWPLYLTVEDIFIHLTPHALCTLRSLSPLHDIITFFFVFTDRWSSHLLRSRREGLWVEWNRLGTVRAVVQLP